LEAAGGVNQVEQLRLSLVEAVAEQPKISDQELRQRLSQDNQTHQVL
jgi:hypothetical protein